MINQTISLNNNLCTIKIQYAKVNGIVVRLNPLGDISIKANPRYDLNYIYDYLDSIKPWLNKKQEVIAKNKKLLSIEKCLNHQAVWIFGQLLEIKTNDYLNKPFLIDNAYIYFSKKDTLNRRYLKLIRQYYQNSLINLFNEIVNDLEYNMPPILEFKYYTSKWGVCYPRENKIILNERLCHLPIDLVKLVIYHELVHLKVHNHSKNFYQELAKVCPNYTHIQKTLPQYSFVLMKEY